MTDNNYQNAGIILLEHILDNYRNELIDAAARRRMSQSTSMPVGKGYRREVLVRDAVEVYKFITVYDDHPIQKGMGWTGLSSENMPSEMLEEKDVPESLRTGLGVTPY